jgi:calcineurin-like phosphoesterase family protein
MRYFIADTHFGHWKLVSNFPRLHPGFARPFESIEEHDEYLLATINYYVNARDELFVLGDFCTDKPGRYRAKIKCRHVYLIRGNHDPVQASRNVFGEIPYIRHTKLRYGGKSMHAVLCHNPMAFWEGSHNGWAHLYGHCHGRREGTLDTWMPGRRSTDVSVDASAFHIHSEEELYLMFYDRPGHDLKSFYPPGLNNV